jgi:hypothetical protein
MYSVMGTVLISVADPDPYVLRLSDAEYEVRIRILLSSSKTSKKTLIPDFFMTFYL